MFFQLISQRYRSNYLLTKLWQDIVDAKRNDDARIVSNDNAVASPKEKNASVSVPKDKVKLNFL